MVSCLTRVLHCRTRVKQLTIYITLILTHLLNRTKNHLPFAALYQNPRCVLLTKTEKKTFPKNTKYYRFVEISSVAGLAIPRSLALAGGRAGTPGRVWGLGFGLQGLEFKV